MSEVVRRRVLLAAAIATTVIEILDWHRDHAQLRNILLSGFWIEAGLVAWWRRPDNNTGKVMVLTGIAFGAFLAEGTRVAFLWTLGSALEPAFVIPLSYLLLSFPRGELGSTWERAFVWMTVAFVAYAGIQGSFFYDPCQFGVPDCPPHLNLLLVHRSPGWVQTTGNWSHGWGTAILVALTVVIVARFLRGTAPAKRILGPVLVPAAAFLLTTAAQQFVQFAYAIWHVILFGQRTLESATDAAFIAGIALPVTFLLGIATARARHGRVSTLVLELGDLPPLDELQRALSRTLGDPSLRVGRWDAEAGRYVPADGGALEIPDDDASRTATFLERAGRPLAMIVHDPALLEDHGLLDSVGAAARFVMETDRLQAELRAKLEEVQASRARIVHAADAERQRLERDLHDGAQQRLASIVLDLKLASSRFDPSTDAAIRQAVTGAAQGVETALAELRELARGIHPSVLTEEGVEPALRSLAERGSLPTSVAFDAPGRFDPSVEAAAYFVVSEALANVTKHAQASRALITVTREGDHLVVEVADDGIGGADPAGGSGLAGLEDRVGALGGRLQVKSSRGDGTRVVAEIPCREIPAEA
jgi:signal transduction histidine kinase